jgi:SAM-dependent methyltransferase
MKAQFDLFPAWPSSMIETLSSCPICNSDASTILHEDVSDQLFGVPGSWTIWRCHACGVAYLNPRLTPEAIGEAYRRYYTHDAAANVPSRYSLRKFVADAYAKHRLSARPSPHLFWSGLAARWIFPGIEKHLEAQYRYLPPARLGATLLDVGCGNGDFLLKVQPLGWKATGLEFDPGAHAFASSRNLHVVKGSVPGSGLPNESFDAITMHHVIEHVHDPRAVLIELFRLLKPGGTISLTTPNWCSYGANLYGRYWRGLEPPRHLVLFTPSTLVNLARDIGFITPTIHVQPESAHFYFRQSLAIAESATGGPVDFLSDPVTEVERACDAARSDNNLAEEFTLVAAKPGRKQAAGENGI